MKMDFLCFRKHKSPSKSKKENVPIKNLIIVTFLLVVGQHTKYLKFDEEVNEIPIPLINENEMPTYQFPWPSLQ